MLVLKLTRDDCPRPIYVLGRSIKAFGATRNGSTWLDMGGPSSIEVLEPAETIAERLRQATD